MSDAAVYAFAQATLLGQGYSEAEIQFALTVCRLETGYSTRWKPGQGAGSNNWGAVQEPDPSKPHFEHVDTHADGSKYTGRFKVYPSMFHGLSDAARTILKPNVRAAVARGDGSGAVEAMRANKYFEAPVDRYIAAMKRNYPKLVQGAGLQPLLSFDAVGGSSLALLLLGLVLVGGRRGW
jgi:hypothetical protein